MSDQKPIYTCVLCGDDFTSQITIEQAYAMAERTYGPKPDDCDMAVVCSPCHDKYLEWLKQHHPEKVRDDKLN